MLRVVAVLALVVGVAGCGKPRVCTPGQQVTCPCSGGTPGVQTCDPEGDRFGECRCARQTQPPTAAAPGGPAAASAPAPSPKGRLQPKDIQAGMRGILGKVEACFARHKSPGKVEIKVTIAPQGHVAAAEAVGPFAKTPQGTCIEDAVRKARFPAVAGDPLTITYPFVLR